MHDPDPNIWQQITEWFSVKKNLILIFAIALGSVAKVGFDIIAKRPLSWVQRIAVLLLCVTFGIVAWWICKGAGMDMNTNFLGIVAVCVSSAMGEMIFTFLQTLLQWLSTLETINKIADWIMRRKKSD